MEYKRFRDYYVVRLDKGDEVVESITKLCDEENITLGSISGLGACNYVKIGLYDTINKQYESHVFTGLMEITSLTGNISTKENKTYLHMHINVCNDKMEVFGGHLNSCIVSATCEIIITKIDGKVNRIMDENIGINMFDFEKVGEV